MNPREHPLTMLVAHDAPSDFLEHLTLVAFEQLRVPALYFMRTPVAALIGCGRTTGCVIDCGFRTTSVACVYEGAVYRGGKTLHLGSADVTDRLLMLLANRGCVWQRVKGCVACCYC